MVLKVSKGGVRTGNTLRGLHSTRTKRYGRQACLMGCTSLGRRDLARLVSSCSDQDQQMVSDALSKTNVLLSLNKQQRWRLPALVGHMIRQGQFNKGAVVSMLERHKLKRRANCVSLVSNSARNRVIAPKQKKYFSFSLDTVANEQSHRQQKKSLAMSLKRLQTSKHKMYPKVKSHYKTIEAFTSDGTATKAKPEHTKLVDSDKPEYRLEVLYPCPQTCSLTYNPKYTDVTIAEGKTGKLEVKSIVKPPKKKSTTHRKRFTTRDLEDLCDEAEDDNVQESWSYHSEDLKPSNGEYEGTINRDYESDFAMLLLQAQKARDACLMNKESCRRKTQRKGKCSSSFHENSDKKKSHIVYINEDDDLESESTNLISDPWPIVSDKSVQVADTTEKGCVSDLESCRVILPTSEVTPGELRQQFGSLYSEAFCSPRRFVIDITEDVSNVLGASKAVLGTTDFSTYLVCVHDGFYDDGLEAFKVTLNSMTGGCTQGLSGAVPFTRTSIPDVMNGVVSHLLDLKEKNMLQFELRDTRESKTPRASDFLSSRIKLKVEVFDPSHSLASVSIGDENERAKEVQQSTADIHPPQHDELSTDLDEEIFCDVCYASVTFSKLDSLPATKLKQCGHVMCDQCWASHFRTSIRDGKLRMSCAGYECSTDVGAVTLLSVLDISEVAALLQRQAEERLETMDNAKWCPHPGCGRIITVNSKLNDLCVDVHCKCGNKVCFSCFGPAHWPAKCDQAEEYLEQLPNLKPMNEYVEEKDKPINVTPKKKKKEEPTTMLVEGRLCPRCQKFIEKNGGCPHMVCKCGYFMCWTCMRPVEQSLHACVINYAWVHNHTRVLVVRHATAAKPVALPHGDEEDEPPHVPKNKQRASLYQRALHERTEKTSIACTSSDIKVLAGNIIKAANKDPQFELEILTAFSDESLSVEVPSWQTTNVSVQVYQLLASCRKMRQELHHVTEFTYILLQGMPNSVAKQRILKLTNDLSGISSIVRSILEYKENQSVRVAFRRLVSLREWAKRALDALIGATRKVRTGTVAEYVE